MGKGKKKTAPDPLADFLLRGKRAALAMRVFVHPGIQLANSHVSGTEDSATALLETIQTGFLLRANRSSYENAPGGDVPISIELLEGMLALAQEYSYSVTEIAGGSHSKKSRHYVGTAMDVGSINGETVSIGNKHVSGFLKSCKKLGATEVLGPGDAGHAHHIHAAWPRPKD